MFGGAEATGNSIIYSLPYKARCIAPQLAHEDNSRFFAGTTTLKEENEVRAIYIGHPALALSIWWDCVPN